jgi:phage repressor protein C with HTH and peptisase S24 domain
MSQSALADRVGIRYQSIQAIEKKGGRTRHLMALARALGVRPLWLETGEGPMEEEAPVQPPSEEVTESSPSAGLVEVEMIGPTPRRDIRDTIPVRAARGGPTDVEMFVDDDPIDYRPRPPSLAGVSNAYMMWVSGTSMMPVVRPGWTLHVDPNLRPQPGDIVIVWKSNNAVVVKELVRRSPQGVTLREYHNTIDGQEFVLPERDVLAVHKVVGADYR